ncbi:hypothetical protein GEV33_010382 [Tenebrio molitor]|uniref:Proteasome subunit alpha type-2 n=1 Tax=Tenebrio molitor TaxID=7067 RepID=A0A8J6LAT1_TENMO|nr:hypothetical protein GEV33_010382 [Tenebrio molitor]
MYEVFRLINESLVSRVSRIHHQILADVHNGALRRFIAVSTLSSVSGSTHHNQQNVQTLISDVTSQHHLLRRMIKQKAARINAGTKGNMQMYGWLEQTSRAILLTVIELDLKYSMGSFNQTINRDADFIGQFVWRCVRYSLPTPSWNDDAIQDESRTGPIKSSPLSQEYFLDLLIESVYENNFASPSGKLVQIEYALAAVAAGAPSVGIKASNGVVIATENKHKSILYEEHSVHKVEMITKHIGMIYSGMGPDYRLLVKQARKMAQKYFLTYREPIPTVQLVQRVAAVMQEYTQSGGVRPFGVSLLICGWDSGRPYLFQCDPSGAYFAWKATAMGKNYINGKTFLEKRYSEDLELDDAVHTAILTLKESFEGQMTADNIEVGICDESGFRRLEPSHVKDYLANIP